MMIVLVLLVAAVVSFVVTWTAARWLKAQFPQMTRDALRQMGEEFIGLAKGSLALEREKGLGDLETNRQAVESSVKGLDEQLKRYEQLVRRFELDRERKYGQLEQHLKQVVTGSERLQQTTAALTAVLGNSRIRGQWGQKMAGDILRLCGLQEGIQYRQEEKLVTGRPDYTFFLPDQHQLFMDVKFPLENYLKLASSVQENEQERWREAFLKDVREHLREMERRDYVAQADRSVDYILIFIPNEQVYGLINESLPSLIDECLQKRMILCGPWTLYAIVRVIWQAWQHYHYSEAVHEIVRTIKGFGEEYTRFKTRFEELGDRLRKTTEQYDEITRVSFRKLEQRIQQIDDYRKGRGLSDEVPEAERIPVGAHEAGGPA